MRQIILDAGPLIGAFYSKDTYHQQCIMGFTELKQHDVKVRVPLPIVFEVYKWLLHHTYPSVAQRALREINRDFYIIPIEEDLFIRLQDAVYLLPNWAGSLEDAAVMLVALQYRCPVWTYNFRDFSIFESLEFWNPS